MQNTRRFPLHEDKLPHTSLPGDVKERLQVRPEVPAKKKPAGQVWAPFESEDRMGVIGSDDAVSTHRRVLSLNQYDRTPSMDNDQALQDAAMQKALASNGLDHGRNVLREHFTDESNEQLYEVVEDKESGNKGLLYRQNLFDRY